MADGKWDNQVPRPQGGNKLGVLQDRGKGSVVDAWRAEYSPRCGQFSRRGGHEKELGFYWK